MFALPCPSRDIWKRGTVINCYFILAVLDPAGPIPAACGFVWTFTAPAAAVAALVAVALCPFRRTARQAYRLSKVALWTRTAGFFAAVGAMVSTAGEAGAQQETAPDSVLLLRLSAVAPAVAAFTFRFSRSRMGVVDSFRIPQPNQAKSNDEASFGGKAE